MAHKELTWVMHRKGGAKDGITGVLPTLPVRLNIVGAWRKAQGFDHVTVTVVDDDTGEEHEEEEFTLVRDGNGADLLAIGYAALGLCWLMPDLPSKATFRGYERDAVAYGEQVMTDLAEAGYIDTNTNMEVADVLLHAMEESIAKTMAVEVKVAEEGFGTAQP